MVQVIIDKEKCDGCEYCIKGCPQSVLALDAEGKAEVVKPESCEFCWNCVYNCPIKAVAID